MKSTLSNLASKLYVPFAILALALLSYAISRAAFGNESLRLDEAQTIWQTSHSLKETLFIVAQDVHVPLYHIIFHYWILFFGTDTATIRFLSFIFFALSLPFVYLLGRTIVSRNWALLATALFAFSPFVNWYANEARMYTLLALMSLMSQYFFVCIMQGKKNSWLWYTIVAVVGVYSHYFFMFNLLAQGLFFLATRKRFPARSFRKFIGVAVLAAISIAPWIVYFIAQGAASNTRPHITAPTPVDFFNVYSQFIFGFQGDILNTILVSSWPLLVVLALVMVRRHTKAAFPVNYILTAAFIPVLMAFLLSFVISPFFLSRYMIAAVAPIFILVIWVISRYTKRVALIVTTIVFIFSSLLYYQQMQSPETPVRENYKAVSEDITATATSHDVIAMSSPFTVYPLEYYYHGSLQIRTIPPWDRQNPGPVSAFSLATLPGEVDDLKKGHDYIYLVLSYDQGYETQIRDYFRNHFELVSQKTYSPKLTVLKYRVGYKDSLSYTK